MCIINAECGKTVVIGYQGENKRQRVRFDLSDIMAEFPGGTAVLYTMEYKLLRSCLDRSKGLVLRERKRTEAGGLLPWIFVVDREETR